LPSPPPSSWQPHQHSHHRHHQHHLQTHPTFAERDGEIDDGGEEEEEDDDDDDDGYDGGSSGELLARLVRSVESLMAEVRGLKRNNEQLHQDLEALQLQQHAADQKVAQLLAAGAGQAGEPERKRPRPPRPSSPVSYSSSSSSSSSQPPLPSPPGSPSPLFEARRLIAFVGPYILPSNFAIPDFRFCPTFSVCGVCVCRVVCRVLCVVCRVCVRVSCALSARDSGTR
jgi:hypothetical protein